MTERTEPEYPFRSLPVAERRGIPFYYRKSPAEFRADPYERYDPMVLRQTAVQLAGELRSEDPYREVLEWCLAKATPAPSAHALDLGCGVGRLVGELAQRRPDWACYGVDTSYQLLRQADRYWRRGEILSLDESARGYEPIELTGHRLPNVSFALAKAENLPLVKDSFTLITAIFLFDRLADPAAALAEVRRILRPGGRLLLVLPYNFQRPAHWAELYPPARFREWLAGHSWRIEERRNFAITEPLDRHGNALHWRAEGFFLRSI